MSLSRVKELVAAAADGSIRPDELRELWALLPGVIEMAEKWQRLDLVWAFVLGPFHAAKALLDAIASVFGIRR